MKLYKFAAIDIGTNAVRLFIANVVEDRNQKIIKKSSLIRVPLRLGENVFEYGEIGEEKIKKLLLTMHSFQLLMQVNDVVTWRACATSAMREATNGEMIIELIKQETGINIEIISGQEEAEIIRSTQLKDLFKQEENFLFVDVGGGSTEITLYKGNNVVDTKSFKIGTIRLLKNKVNEDEFTKMKKWLEDFKKKYKNLEIIGSGGNINKIFKLSNSKQGNPLSNKQLSDINDYVNSFSYNDRIKILGLNPDRADVIIPAMELFLKIMKWSNAKAIHVPKIGLSDGIVRKLYSEFTARWQKKRIGGIRNNVTSGWDYQ